MLVRMSIFACPRPQILKNEKKENLLRIAVISLQLRPTKQRSVYFLLLAQRKKVGQYAALLYRMRPSNRQTFTLHKAFQYNACVKGFLLPHESKRFRLGYRVLTIPAEY